MEEHHAAGRQPGRLPPCPVEVASVPHMKFQSTALYGACLIELDAAHDNRGFFARTFCAEEFALHGLKVVFPQHSVSFSARKGTLRGMHYQRDPHGEAKLVRCTRGAIWDVIIDIRRDSPTHGRWQGFELSSVNGRQLYIPEGFAHGFQTLGDDVDVNYLISTPFAPGSAAGFRHDDPAFGINWPLPVSQISEKDLHWPDFPEPALQTVAPDAS